MEFFFIKLFEELNHYPKEFGIKYYQKNKNSEKIQGYNLTLVFNIDFLSSLKTENFHANDLYTGDIIEINGIIQYENRKYIKRYFLKADGKSWFTKNDVYYFHKPFGNHSQCHSAQYSEIRPSQYLIEYFPIEDVVGKIRNLYVPKLDNQLSYRVKESFQFDSIDFKYIAEFIPKESNWY